MDRSLVPANTKRSTLILGMFRPMPDLAILVTGTIITVIMLAVFANCIGTPNVTCGSISTTNTKLS